ncbi:hypothetical protein B0H14DRAFT_3682904 [Mycena olivaceomarginata]|nr:hypothetical protein B0H14DRAFT_3682904 [Mycena olivaceomarginata]
MCCNQGKVVLQELNALPPDLEKLFAEDSTQAKEFRKNIAQYNTALSFTSLGVKEDRSINNGGGPPIFRIHGELCHRAGALLPSAGQQPTYAQPYIYEPRVALDHRMENNTNLRRDTKKCLTRQTRSMQARHPIGFRCPAYISFSVFEDIEPQFQIIGDPSIASAVVLRADYLPPSPRHSHLPRNLDDFHFDAMADPANPPTPTPLASLTPETLAAIAAFATAFSQQQNQPPPPASTSCRPAFHGLRCDNGIWR